MKVESHRHKRDATEIEEDIFYHDFAERQLLTRFQQKHIQEVLAKGKHVMSLMKLENTSI